MTFLHRIEEGPADKSYGIHVAKIAGLPSDLLKRADTILSQLEGQKPRSVDGDSNTATPLPELGEQLSLFVCRHHSPSTRRIKQSRYLQHDPDGSHDGSCRYEKENLKQFIRTVSD